MTKRLLVLALVLGATSFSLHGANRVEIIESHISSNLQLACFSDDIRWIAQQLITGVDPATRGTLASDSKAKLFFDFYLEAMSHVALEANTPQLRAAVIEQILADHAELLPQKRSLYTGYQSAAPCNGYGSSC